MWGQTISEQNFDTTYNTPDIIKILHFISYVILHQSKKKSIFWWNTRCFKRIMYCIEAQSKRGKINNMKKKKKKHDKNNRHLIISICQHTLIQCKYTKLQLEISIIIFEVLIFFKRRFCDQLLFFWQCSLDWHIFCGWNKYKTFTQLFAFFM